MGIKQNTESKIRGAIDLMLNKRQAYSSAVLAQQNKVTAHETADAEGKAILNNCRLRLAKFFGSQYNAQWGAAGFPNQSSSVPDTMDKRFTLLNKLKLHFTANSSQESADMEASATLCEGAHTAISQARALANAADTAARDAMTVRKDALKALRKVIRGLIGELEQLIPEDDSRWESFGLNIPANPSPPEGIEGLTLTPISGGKLLCQWTYASRMTGTRVLLKVPGPGAEFVSQGTVGGLEKTLEDLTPGTTVEVQVVPYNDAGDGAASPVMTVTVE